MVEVALNKPLIPIDTEDAVVGTPFDAKVKADMLALGAPLIGGTSCGGAFSKGELFDITLEIRDGAGVVAHSETVRKCLLYGSLSTGKTAWYNNIIIDEPGTYTARFRANEVEGPGSDSTRFFRLDVLSPDQTPEPRNGGGDGGDGGTPQVDLIQTAIENPIGTGIVVVGGGYVIRQALDSD